MRLLLPAAASLASVFFLVVACGGTDTPSDTTPAAGDDDSGTSTGGSHDASAGDGSTSLTGDGGQAGDSSPAADSGSTPPTADGGDDVACSGTASCSAGDACISDYATAQVATSWCRFGTVAGRVTEYSAACSGYHVVSFSNGVAGESTLDYYDLTTGALVAVVQSKLTSKSCTGSPPAVSATPCDDSTGVTTQLAEACSD